LAHGDRINSSATAVRSWRDDLDQHRGCAAGGAHGGISLFQMSERRRSAASSAVNGVSDVTGVPEAMAASHPGAVHKVSEDSIILGG